MSVAAGCDRSWIRVAKRGPPSVPIILPVSCEGVYVQAWPPSSAHEWAASRSPHWQCAVPCEHYARSECGPTHRLKRSLLPGQGSERESWADNEHYELGRCCAGASWESGEWPRGEGALEPGVQGPTCVGWAYSKDALSRRRPREEWVGWRGAAGALARCCRGVHELRDRAHCQRGGRSAASSGLPHRVCHTTLPLPHKSQWKHSVGATARFVYASWAIKLVTGKLVPSVVKNSMPSFRNRAPIHRRPSWIITGAVSTDSGRRGTASSSPVRRACTFPDPLA